MPDRAHLFFDRSTSRVHPLNSLGGCGYRQAWLLCEAADATLDQTLASLTFSLAVFTGLLEFSGANSRASVVELARCKLIVRTSHA